MHEWGLIRRLLELVEEEARVRRLTRVSRVRVETGLLNDAERAALQLNFQSAAQGTIVQDAQLIIDECPARVLCPHCLNEVLITQHDQDCPLCHGAPLLPGHNETVRLTELVTN